MSIGFLSAIRAARAPSSALLTSLLLAGCGGSGGGGGSSSPTTTTPQTTTSIPGTTAPTNGNPFSVSYMQQFNDTAAATTRQSTDFAAQSFNWGVSNGSVVTYGAGSSNTGSIAPFAATYKSFSYASSKFEYAISHGLTGQGVTVAVMDGGFNVTHEKLAGRIVSSYGSLVGITSDLNSHGTHVASIIAGAPGGQMTGLAPNAKLHLALWGADGTVKANAVESAIQAGASVYNNSWGYGNAFGVETTLATVESHAGATAMGRLGTTLQDFTISSYVESLRKFIQDTTKKGVVVFALSNDSSSTSAAMPAALPALFKRSSDATEQALGEKLAQGWIVAGNGVPTFDSAGKLTSIARLSAKCLEMADSCLFGDGTTKGASSISNTSYDYNTGTSFVAPQISASVALLEQAFPTLPTTDLRKRLLASANNSFFTSYTGTTDFGNGVTHRYNDEFGQGFLDIKAALSPIGAVGTPTTANAYGGVTPLSSSQIVAASNQGGAIQRSLAKASITVFDSLGGDFKVSGAALSGGVRPDMDLERRFKRFTAGLATRSAAFGAPSLTSGGSFASVGEWTFAFGRADDVSMGFGAARAPLGFGAAPGSLQALMPDTLSFGLSTSSGEGSRIAAYAFGSFNEEQRAFIAGSLAERADRRKAFGAGVIQSVSFGATQVSFGASLLGEPGSMLGLQTSGALGGARSLSGALDFGASTPVADRLRAFGSAQIGVASANAGGLMSVDRGVLFSSFGVGLERAGALRDDDALAVSVSQPLRTEAGSASITAPSGRLSDGTVLWQNVGVNLAPDARQLDWTMSYMTPLGAERALKLATTYSTNAGHVAGATAATVLAGFAQRF